MCGWRTASSTRRRNRASLFDRHLGRAVDHQYILLSGLFYQLHPELVLDSGQEVVWQLCVRGGRLWLSFIPEIEIKAVSPGESGLVRDWCGKSILESLRDSCHRLASDCEADAPRPYRHRPDSDRVIGHVEESVRALHHMGWCGIGGRSRLERGDLRLRAPWQENEVVGRQALCLMMNLEIKPFDEQVP